MARIVVWILLGIAITGYVGAQSTPDSTGTTGTVGNMTTENTTESSSTSPSTNPTEQKSTKIPETTPPLDIPTFVTSDQQGNVCMRIALNAQVTTAEEEEEEQVTSKVPEDATIEKSPMQCPKEQKDAYIELSWQADEMEWVLGLMFEATDETYTMTMVNGSYTTENGNMTIWSSDDFDFPDVELGHSVHCKDYSAGPTLYFEEYKFQPFAQTSEGLYGEAEECKSESSGLDTMWIIIISCAGGVVLLLVLVGICAVCSKSKKSTYEAV